MMSQNDCLLACKRERRGKSLKISNILMFYFENTGYVAIEKVENLMTFLLKFFFYFILGIVLSNTIRAQILSSIFFTFFLILISFFLSGII